MHLILEVNNSLDNLLPVFTDPDFQYDDIKQTSNVVIKQGMGVTNYPVSTTCGNSGSNAVDDVHYEQDCY